MKAKHIVLVAAALALAACGNEEILENNESGSTGKVHMTFTAGMLQTRTSLQPADDEGNSAVHWTAGDAIAIYDGTAELCKFEATEVEGSTATLKGEAKVTDTYTAFYPYTDDGTLTFGDGTITFTLPAGQTATAGGFAEGLNPSWAQATDGSKNLTFQNLCALAKFTVDAEGVTEVTLTANQESDALAGGLTYTIADGTLAANDGASRSVTIKGNFEAAKEYYFVVAPGTLTGGITLNYMGEGGKTYVRTTPSEVTFTAGKITNLGALVQDDNFTEALNAAFANAVEEFNPNIGWRANPDGTVSLDEYNKRQIIRNGGPFLHLQNKNITSLAGIEYFTDLETLDCMGTQLTTLDVTKLTSLTDLECNGNQLVSLDVSTLEELKILWCHGNKMTALDITNNAYLGDLKCGNQQDNQQLTLTLWDTKKEFWDRMLNMYSDENSNVTTIVKPSPVEAGHNGYEDDGGEPVLQ